MICVMSSASSCRSDFFSLRALITSTMIGTIDRNTMASSVISRLSLMNETWPRK